jgi:hypothetical protein
MQVGDIFTTDGIEWKIISIRGGMAFGVNAMGQIIHIKVGA